MRIIGYENRKRERAVIGIMERWRDLLEGFASPATGNDFRHLMERVPFCVGMKSKLIESSCTLLNRHLVVNIVDIKRLPKVQINQTLRESSCTLLMQRFFSQLLESPVVLSNLGLAVRNKLIIFVAVSYNPFFEPIAFRHPYYITCSVSHNFS